MLLGVGKTCPTPFVHGDTGIFPTQLSRHIKILIFFNRLKTMSADRLVKRVFCIDYFKASRGQHTWCRDIRQILTGCNHLQTFTTDNNLVNVTQCELHFKLSYQELWRVEIERMNKLSIYKTIKHSIKCEDYLTCTF